MTIVLLGSEFREEVKARTRMELVMTAAQTLVQAGGMYSGGFTHLQSPPFPGSPRQALGSQSRESGPSMERALRPPRHFSAPNLSQVLTLHLSKYCWRGRLVFAASIYTKPA